jgi:hypothetical protein
LPWLLLCADEWNNRGNTFMKFRLLKCPILSSALFSPAGAVLRGSAGCLNAGQPEWFGRG